jgi:hypothetical protein
VDSLSLREEGMIMITTITITIEGWAEVVEVGVTAG